MRIPIRRFEAMELIANQRIMGGQIGLPGSFVQYRGTAQTFSKTPVESPMRRAFTPIRSSSER